MIRLHVEVPLAAGASIAATEAQAHYLGSVMRRVVGDSVHLFNGVDGEWASRIATLSRRGATLVAQNQVRPQHPVRPPIQPGSSEAQIWPHSQDPRQLDGARDRPQSAEVDPWLVFALLKRDNTDLVVQKATELGVSALLPVFTERTNAGRVNLDRLRAIAVEAAEQSERLTVPVLHPPRQLDDVLADWPADRSLFVALERAGAPLLGSTSGPAGLLIGPEGGLGPRDRSMLGACGFVRPVSLGAHILRAETAAIVGLALLQAACWG